MAERIEETETELDVGSEPISPASAMAIGMHQGRRRAATDPDFQAFLRKQSRLIDLQTEHLHEQRAVILARLRLGRWKDRVGLALQAMTGLVGLAIAAAITVMAWQAHEDHGLVVQPFSVPPDLAQRGLTGEVIASRLIDRLSELQAQTTSGRPASSYANNWGQDLKVEIPETGVSIAELNRWLRSWLGRETTISGEVYRTSNGLAVAAHAGTAPSTIHMGADADLDDLVRQSAEDVYAATQPYRYAMYLAERNPDLGIPALERLTSTGDATDRMWAYDGLGGILMQEGDFGAGIRAEASSIAVDPTFVPAWSMRSRALRDMGREEAALADIERAHELSLRFDSRYMDRAEHATRVLAMDSALAAMTGDFGKATREIVAAMPRSGGPSLRDSGELASDQLHLHEVTAARETEAQIAPRAGAGEFDIETVAAAKAIFEAAAAAEIEDWPALWNAYVGIDPNKLGGRGREEITTQVVPFAALARARMGDIAGGQALIAKTPLDCYLCLRTRGQIEALAHDRSGADRWFAEAVRQGPALPFAYMDSGQVLLAKNDADGAVAKLKEAHKLSPRYADPLEAWGEALMAKRDYAKAIKKFAEADKDAPKWGRNYLRWGEALMLSDRYAEARAQYVTANGLDLSKPDRAALNLLLARTASGPLHG